MDNQAHSILANKKTFCWYQELLANVRYDGEYHSIKGLVQPDHPEVREVARVLHYSGNFIEMAQEFVNSFTTYEKEIGDFWATPIELLEAQKGDCDDQAILLCSILRNYIPPEKVFCAFGLWDIRGKADGHMFVVTEGEDGEDRIIEATAGPGKPARGKYIIHGIFNDQFAFSTNLGLREFDLLTVELAEPALRR